MPISYILTHDIGTTGSKSSIYSINERIELFDSFLVEYNLYSTPDGGVEQKADEWWNAVCSATKTIISRTGIDPKNISAMTYCAQLQGSVFVDESGHALRNPMSYMDGRSGKQMERYLNNGIFKINGKWNAVTALKWLYYTGGIAATPKDPLWKYHWVKENEPEIFKRAYKWLDVKDYLILRSTGKYGMTPDSAHLTFLYDTRPGRTDWHKGLCRKFNVNMDHLPPVVQSTDIVGYLLPGAAEEMGLTEGIPVFGGGGDTTLTAVGAGCVDLYDAHIYVGTSGWVLANVDRRMVDIKNYMASILSAIPGMYNYSAEQETSGACLQWVRDHLALDEIGIYLEAKHIAEKSQEYNSLYEFLDEVIRATPPGSGNVIFTPWLHGNRSPREDPYSRGIFFNLNLETGKRQMIRSVLEGMAFHTRWMLEAMEKKIPRRESLRFVGGGAKSAVGCQIMADITGRAIETVAEPQNAGTIGATVVCAVGAGIFKTFSEVKPLIATVKTYEPRKEYSDMYNRNFEVFTKLYENNKKLFFMLNS